MPYPVFRAALDQGDLARVHALAAEMSHVPLGDALRICLLLRDNADQRYGRAAVRWLGRFALEAPDATLVELREAAVALEALPERPDSAMEVLSRLCIRHGVGARAASGDGNAAGLV